ncbi:MAG TPA: hypothetical protein VJO12_14040 [Stellaceae bacterium]|nr:hypothetical protein [Stellaceae bacterium]
MDEAVARAIHVVAVVIWIGGVGFVTMIVLPILRARREPGESMTVFRAVEERFARLARGAVLLAGLSGLYLLYRLDLWDRFQSPRFWWMHAMVIIWLLFAAMLFVVEPLGLDRRAEVAAEADFARLARLHWVLLAASLVTVFGAVAGSHGVLFF